MAEYDLLKGDENVWTVMQKDSRRKYPTSTVDEQNAMVAATPDSTAAWFPIVSDDIISKHCEDLVGGATTAANLEMLRRVVPGDIWVKDSTSDLDTWPRDHIAIVAWVPKNAYELDAATLMDQIILIEGEFANKIQSVIKKLSVGDYNHSNLTSPRTIYSGISFPKDGLDLNCQSWAIRRLM